MQAELASCVSQLNANEQRQAELQALGERVTLLEATPKPEPAEPAVDENSQQCDMCNSAPASLYCQQCATFLCGPEAADCDKQVEEQQPHAHMHTCTHTRTHAHTPRTQHAHRCTQWAAWRVIHAQQSAVGAYR